MYLPQWIRVIRENSRKRRAAFHICSRNFAETKSTADSLADWRLMSRVELEAAIQVMAQAHLVVLADKLNYLSTLRLMGTLENLIYTPEVAKQQKEMDEFSEALEFMMNTTKGYIAFILEVKESGLRPDIVPKTFGE